MSLRVGRDSVRLTARNALLRLDTAHASVGRLFSLWPPSHSRGLTENKHKGCRTIAANATHCACAKEVTRGPDFSNGTHYPSTNYTMAWNGRNESILGAKPETEPALIADSSSSPTNEEKADADNSSAVRKQPVPAPVPSKSVWNGSHKNILAHMPKETLPSPEGEKLAAAPPKPKSSQSEPLQIVASPPKDCGISKPKEDEATNSTAGSSTTNTIAEDDPSGTTDEGAAVLADTVSSEPEKKEQECGADQQNTKSQELDDSAPTSTVITKKQRPRKNSESSQNARKHRGKNSISNGNSKNTPRPNGTGSRRRGK